MLKKFPVAFPKSAIEELTCLFVPDVTSPHASLELAIRIDVTGLRVRDFAEYLTLMDKICGHLNPKGLKSYAQRTKQQVKLSHVRKGSWELVIKEIIAQSDYLIILGLFLKYVPNIFRALTAGYRDVEEGRLARERRRQIREQIRTDTDTGALSERRVNQLTHLLDYLGSLEPRHLPKAERFSREQVTEINLRVTSEENDEGGSES